MSWIYLDNNATTQPAPQVVAAVTEVNEQLWANPSSVHRFGQMVRQRVELARGAVAKLIGAKDREILFTSGGTESNNLALRGTLWPRGAAAGAGNPQTPSPAAADGGTLSRKERGADRVLITTKVEHAAIREPAAALVEAGVQVVYLPINRDGWVDPAALAAALEEHVRPGAAALVSVQWANNETGVIQPVAELAAVIAAHRDALKAREAAAPVRSDTGGNNNRTRVLFHVDATQAVGKLPVNVNDASAFSTGAAIDLMTFSAHKFHGPKGVGALYIRGGVKIHPQNLGGPQERDRRGGTENTSGIVGMGVAAELAEAFLKDAAAVARQRELRDRLERGLCEALSDAVVNSAGKPRAWNTTNLGFPRLEAEAILLGLSERGLCASAGAACSSGSLEPSPVLLAMGIPPIVAHGSVRFSLSRWTTHDEIDEAIRIVPLVVDKLRRTLPVGV